MDMRRIEYHDTIVRVRYAETDQMGVVYHANYLIWFEVGRVELMRALGIEYKRMEIEDDCHIVVADAHCRYTTPRATMKFCASARGLRSRETASSNSLMKCFATRTKSARQRRNDARDLREQRPSENACRKNIATCCCIRHVPNPDRSDA